MADWLQRKSTDAGFDQTAPTVLAAHLHVRGSELTTAYKMSDRDDVLFDVGELHPDWRYVALGHIHQPQCLGGGETVRYPGSLDRLEFGETHDTHGIVVFDVVGAVGVRPHPADVVPHHHRRRPGRRAADHAREVPGPRHGHRAVLRPPALSRDEVSRHLKWMFPHWHTLAWVEPAPPAPAR